jgi:hypothetical protein
MKLFELRAFVGFMLLILLFCFDSNAQITDTLDFPFIERFTDGSLETNNWSTDCDNWNIVLGEGTPSPSVRFSGYPEIGGVYNCSLTSNWISKANIGDEGFVSLKFDLNMHADDSSLVEKMYVEVFDSLEWHSIMEISHISNVWDSRKKDITTLLTHNYFKIRFRISGLNSSAGEYWGLDNIFVYNGAIAPKDISGSYYWYADSFGVNLQWIDEQPIGSIAPLSWCEWPWFEGNTGVGTNSQETWSWAAKWDSLPYNADSLPFTRVRSYIQDIDFDSLVFKIWRGSNGDILQYSKNISIYAFEGEVCSFFISPPLMLYDTSELWFGYTVYGQVDNTFPAGLEMEDPVVGYGNLVKFGDQAYWDTLSNYNILGNWSLFLDFNEGVYYTHNGYNIYRKDDDGDMYSLLKHIDYKNTEENSYFDKYPSVDFQTSYWYKITNQYTDNSCILPIIYESLPAYAPNSDDDFVMVFVTSGSFRNYKGMKVYPNPAVDNIQIISPEGVDLLCIYSLNASLIYFQEYHGQREIIIDVSKYKKGIYMLKAKTKNGVIIRKFVKN